MVDSKPHSLDAVFNALADPTRRALLREISSGPQPVGELAKPFPMSLAAVSKHLDVLERASLIQRQRHGKQRMVIFNPGPLQAAEEWLAYYQNFWSGQLDHLQAHFEQEY